MVPNLRATFFSRKSFLYWCRGAGWIWNQRLNNFLEKNKSIKNQCIWDHMRPSTLIEVFLVGGFIEKHWSNWIIFPNFRVKIKNRWNHHPTFFSFSPSKTFYKQCRFQTSTFSLPQTYRENGGNLQGSLHSHHSRDPCATTPQELRFVFRTLEVIRNIGSDTLEAQKPM